MDELAKIDRVVRRRVPGAPHETLLVLDATVGQNAVRQLQAFKATVDVSGIILAKLDSSARGGIIVALQQEYGVPVKLVGTGEGLEDLEAFDPQAFVEAELEAERATGPQVVGDELLQHDGTSTSQRCAIAPTSAIGIGGAFIARAFASLVIHGCATCPSKRWSTRA